MTRQIEMLSLRVAHVPKQTVRQAAARVWRAVDDIIDVNGSQEPLFSGFESAVLIPTVFFVRWTSAPVRPIGRTGACVVIAVSQ